MAVVSARSADVALIFISGENTTAYSLNLVLGENKSVYFKQPCEDTEFNRTKETSFWSVSIARD